jgi:hypothetical protein
MVLPRKLQAIVGDNDVGPGGIVRNGNLNGVGGHAVGSARDSVREGVADLADGQYSLVVSVPREHGPNQSRLRQREIFEYCVKFGVFHRLRLYVSIVDSPFDRCLWPSAVPGGTRFLLLQAFPPLTWRANECRRFRDSALSSPPSRSRNSTDVCDARR